MEHAWYVNEETGALFLLSEYQVAESRREPGASRLRLVETPQEGSEAPENTTPANEPDQDDNSAQEPVQEPVALDTEDETEEISAELVDEAEAQAAAPKRRGRPSR